MASTPGPAAAWIAAAMACGNVLLVDAVDHDFVGVMVTPSNSLVSTRPRSVGQ